MRRAKRFDYASATLSPKPQERTWSGIEANTGCKARLTIRQKPNLALASIALKSRENLIWHTPCSYDASLHRDVVTMDKLNLLLGSTALATTLGALVAPSAKANPVLTTSYTVWYPGTGSGAPTGAPSGTANDGMSVTPWSGDPNNYVLIPQFNATQSEVLTGIVLSIEGDINATLQAKNTGGAAATFGSAANAFAPAAPWTYDLGISLLAPGGTTLSEAIVTALPIATSLAGYSLAAGTTSFQTIGSVSNSTAFGTPFSTSNPTALAVFEGTGTVDLPLLTSSATTGVCYNCDNVSYSLSTYAAAGVTITYDYTIPAPEPASLAVIGSALFGLGSARLRRRRV